MTWFFTRHPELFRQRQLKPRPEWKDATLRLALDEERDFELIQKIFDRLYKKNQDFGLKEILDLYRRDPELFLINRDVAAKS